MKISQQKLEVKLHTKKNDARKRGIEFSLVKEDLKALFERNNGACDYTGLPFNTERTPTIERIDDKVGYVRGNLCLVSVEANQLKDTLLDKTHIQSFRLQRNLLPILDTLRTKLTPEYLDHLKLKYRADCNYNPGTDLYKDHFKGLTEIEVQPILQQATKNDEEPVMTDMTEEVKPTSLKKLPPDVHIATYYSSLAKMAQRMDMDFDISYAEFKGRMSRKTCAFSGKILGQENKFMLVMDKKKPFSKENLTVVDEEFGLKLTKMSEDIGLSIQEMAKMFKRLV